MNRYLGNVILRRLLFILYAVASLPLILAVIWLASYLEKHGASQAIVSLPVLILLVYLFALGWFSNRTADYIAFQEQGFLQAVKCAWYEAKLSMTFVPIVGHWFTPKPLEEGPQSNTYACQCWRMKLAEGWDGNLTADGHTISHSKGSGVLQVRAYRRTDGAVSVAGLLRSIPLANDAKARLLAADRGEFRGFQTHHSAEDRFFSRWWLTKGDVVLVLNYTCTLGDQKTEAEAVTSMLNSLRKGVEADGTADEIQDWGSHNGS